MDRLRSPLVVDEIVEPIACAETITITVIVVVAGAGAVVAFVGGVFRDHHAQGTRSVAHLQMPDSI